MKIRVISSADVSRCPITSLLPYHYRDDGTCLCTSEEKPEVKAMSVMHTLDRGGDSRIMWDHRNEDEVAAARKQFDDLRAKGYMAYRAEGKEGTQGTQMRRFDPDAERIILVKPVQGG